MTTHSSLYVLGVSGSLRRASYNTALPRAAAEQAFDAEGRLVDAAARGFLQDLLAALARWTQRVSQA